MAAKKKSLKKKSVKKSAKKASKKSPKKSAKKKSVTKKATKKKTAPAAASRTTGPVVSAQRMFNLAVMSETVSGPVLQRRCHNT